MKKNKGLKTLQAVFLILAFGILTGFAPVLHSHDFDLDEVHQDCAPCQWSQHNAGSEALWVDFSFSLFIQPFSLTSFYSVSCAAQHPVSNKSPPTQF